MWFLKAVLIYLGVCFGIAFLGEAVAFAVKCIKYIKERIPDIFVFSKEERIKRRTKRKMGGFMEQAIPELYKYFTEEQREYCSQTSSMEEFGRRYREVVLQNPDIVRAYFDDLKAGMKATDK